MDEKKSAAIIPLDSEDRHSTIPDLKAAVAPAHAKLADAITPGFQAEFDPAEADAVGAFREDALSENDAIDSILDFAPFAAIAATLKS